MLNHIAESNFYWITIPDWLAGLILPGGVVLIVVIWLIFRRRRTIRR